MSSIDDMMANKIPHRGGFSCDRVESFLNPLANGRISYKRKLVKVKDKEFLMWLYERLQFVHNENPNVDYMKKLLCVISITPEDKLTPNV